MARYSAADVSWFLVAGLDVVGTLTEFEDRREARTEETHTLGDGWAEHSFVGVREGEITQSGFYDDAAGSIHDVLSSGPGTTNVLSYCLEGTATGRNFVGWAGGVQVNYHRLAERDALTKAKASYKNMGAVEQGKTLWPYKAVGTATGIKNTVDNLVSTTNGGAGYLHWNASAGECVVNILHSSDGGVFAELLAFTKTTSGHGAQRVTVAGNIKRYTAANFSTNAATGDIAALNAFVGLVRG